ncbi:MAG TPA: MATE family efflux transporter [Trueperaceae bacterium]
MRSLPPRTRRVFGQVWQLALPVIIANMLQSLVNVADVFLAGRLGPIEIAAVGMGTSVRMLVLVGIMAITAGCMALAAQARGAGDDEELSLVTRQSLSLAVLLSVLLSAIGFFGAEPILRFLNSGGDPRAVELGTDYLQILFAGTIFLTLNFTINSLMQGAGDTVTPLYISGGMNVLNVLFSSVLMFGPGPLPALGVSGAAFGTVLARAFAVVAGISLFYSGRNAVRILPGSYLPNTDMFRQILSIGVPSGAQGIARNAAQIMVLRIVTSTAAGTYGASALAIGLQVESLAFMPGLAVSVAATSLVGRSLGAWQVEEARERGNAAVALGALLMGTLGLLLWIFATPLVRLFDPSAHPTVIAAGTAYLRINALSQPILAVAMVVNGGLRGAGDTRPPLVATIVGRWLVVVPLAYFLALQLGMGVNGVWWALFAGTCIQAVYVAARWLSGKWLQVGLRKSRLYRIHLRHLPEEEQRRFLYEVKAPLMASGATRERVEEEGVVYQLPSGRVQLAFDGSYRVVSGHELLPEPGADSGSDELAEPRPAVADRRPAG